MLLFISSILLYYYLWTKIGHDEMRAQKINGSGI